MSIPVVHSGNCAHSVHSGKGTHPHCTFPHEMNIIAFALVLTNGGKMIKQTKQQMQQAEELKMHGDWRRVIG